MERRKIADGDIKEFYALNTWTEDLKRKVREALETGVWVYLGSSAAGHTRAEMTKQDGLDWLNDEYIGVLQTVIREGWGYKVSRLR